MLDVHPPHETLHGWRDFLLHIATITIGLLIALSLEGCVEWQHHRHLVHEAQRSLHAEIAKNSENMQSTLDALHKEQASLKQDVVMLTYIMQHHAAPKDSSMELGFNIREFSNVGWKTAESTGALSFMPYEQAQQYADIYAVQTALEDTERVAARDLIVSLGPFLNSGQDDPDPTHGEAAAVKEKIEVLQAQLLLVNSYMTGLDTAYKKFLAEHPA